MRNWIIGTGAIILASCSQNSVDTRAAEGAVAQFRRQMEAGQFEAIYANGTPELRQGGSEAVLIRFLDRVASRLGRVVQTTRQGWRVTTNPNGTYVSLNYATIFDRGRGNEEFVFRMNGGQAQLAGYHINSMDLMIDQIAPTNDQAAGNEVTPVEALPVPSGRNEMESRPATR